jgi:hypothetical protein
MKMKKLEKFRNFSKIDIGSIWGGAPGNCYTLVTVKGATKDPCGDSDDQLYMELDSSTGASSSSTGQAGA